MNTRRVAWLLIGGVALTASLVGHAAQIALENVRALGDARAFYHHSAQAPIGQIAVALLALAAILTVGRIASGARAGRTDSDWLLPALAGVRVLGVGRLTATVLGVQLVTLTCGELAEQFLSTGAPPGLTAVFGPGHATAPFVHLIVGLALSIALRAFALCACEHVAQIARIVRLVVTRPARARTTSNAALRQLILRASFLLPPVLARRIANRPPPSPGPILAPALA